MARFMLLYLGPSAEDVGLDHAPLTQAGLDQWTQKAGNAVVDRGTLFEFNGGALVDNGRVLQGSLPVHGYSIVQAEDLKAAMLLMREHPFLANGGQGNFEIQILPLTSEERPLSPPNLETQPGPVDLNTFTSSPSEASSTTPAPPATETISAAPEEPTATEPTEPAVPPPAPGELNIPHEEDNQQNPPDQNPPGTTLPPVPGN